LAVGIKFTGKILVFNIRVDVAETMHRIYVGILVWEFQNY